MLGKLIKHEWKAVWKFMTAINIFMICLTIVGAFGILFFYRFDVNDNPLLIILYTCYIVTYILGIMGVSLATMIYLGVRFYKSMYGDEGYLTHTLPATPLQLIVSKALIAFLWIWIYALLMIFSILVLLLCVNVAAGYPIGINDISEGFNAFMVSIDYSPLSICLLYGLYTIIATISGIFMMYASIATGQLFDKHRILSAVGIYFGFSTILQILTSIASGVISYSSMQASMYNGRLTVQLYTWFLLFYIIISTVFFFLLTYLLTKKKLNLE